MKRKEAHLYIRVSTDEQADTGYSQRHQEETLRRYCELQGINIRGVWFEDHSAKTFERPQWKSLLLKLKKDRGVDYVLFTKWDRFSRNAGDAYFMISHLNSLGVDPQAIEQPLNLEVPENKMMLAFYLAAPEVENDRRSLNIRGGMRRARKEGRWMGKAPLGYKNQVVDGQKSIVIDPVEGPIMKWAFEELSKGIYNVRSVMLRAAEKGLTTKSGRPVSKTSFWSAIRNPAYAGYIRVAANKSEDELLVRGRHAALITPELFYRVQDVLFGNRKRMRTRVREDENFPLRGFLVCPECGRLLTASNSKGRNHYYSYYHCFSGCDVRFAASTVNQAFTGELKRWKPHPAASALYKVILNGVLGFEVKARVTKAQILSKELKNLVEYKDRLRKLRISGELDADDYRIEKKEAMERELQLESELGLLRSGEDLRPKMESAFSLLSHLDVAWEKQGIEWKRAFVGSIFPEKLVFSKDGFRTARVNDVARLIYSITAGFSEKTNGDKKNISICTGKLSY